MIASVPRTVGPGCVGLLLVLAVALPSLPAAAFEMTVFDAQGRPRATVELAPPGIEAGVPVRVQELRPAPARVRDASSVDAQFLSSGGGAATAHRSGGSHRLGVEVRRDDLRWSITPLTGSPSPVSELHWRGIGSAGVVWQGSWPLSARWRLDGEAGLARRLSGSVRDSDYDQSGRQAEFSRSVASTSGSTLGSLRAGLGWLALEAAGGATLHLEGGLALHRHELTIARAEQRVSTPSTRFPDLEMPPVGVSFDAGSRYRLRWAGSYLGFALRWPLGEGLVMGADYRFERLRLEGEGRWALREDLAQPVSFTQSARGRVHAAGLSLARALSARSGIDVGIRHVNGRSGGGRHDMRSAGDHGIGLGLAMQLDGLRWRSTALQVGYRLDF